MKRRLNLELIVGAFMVVGLACLAYLSINLGKMEIWGKPGYEVFAIFSDVGGLRSGAPVVIAGVDIGRVESIVVKDYEARVGLRIEPGLRIQEDAIVSVRTSGLIGEKYIRISPGAAEETIEPGGRVRLTESAVDIEALISKFAFGDL